MKRSSEYVRQLLDQARSEQGGGDLASATAQCRAHGCDRAFRSLELLQEHAEAVHTFGDISRILSEYLREEFGRQGNYSAEPPVPSIWVWIDDVASDWVVFMVEEGNESKLLKATYAIVDGAVTLSEPVEVRRRTVYEAISR